jgi:hypothetical protein
MNALFDPGREGFSLGEIDWDTAVVKASLVQGYTFNAAHKFVSDVTTAGGVLAATATLAGRTAPLGVHNATSPITFTAVPSGAPITGILIYQSSAVTGGADVAATAQRVIAFIDGKSRFTIAAISAISGTSIVVDPTTAPFASGAVANRITGTGPATITTAAVATAGSRAMTTTALSAATVVNDVYEATYQNANLPITPNGGDITHTIDAGANKLFKL